MPNLLSQMTTSQFVSSCPSCQSRLRATRLSCPSCSVQLEGQFEVPPLLRLAPDDIAFIERFVRASGSLKQVAAEMGKSYPTIRNRLDQVIAALDEAQRDREAARTQILAAIEAGEIDAAEGIRRLKEVGA